MKRILLPLLCATVFGCHNKTAKQQTPFETVAVNYNNTTVQLPKGFTYQILFSEGDSVVNKNGLKAPAKGSHDMVIYIPIDGSSEHGYLYVNHEEHKPNTLLGDGGGGTIFEVKKEANEWRVVGDYQAIDFAPVGETFRNCGGTLTPHGTIITTEEEFPLSNTEIYARFGITDTSDYEGKKKYLNYGWAVEVDPVSKKALRKIKNFGRFPHEDAQCMPDRKTVYLTSDDRPSVLYKFVADKKDDYSSGQLYAYQQSADGATGNWLTLPMQEDSLENITDVALRQGATMFVSHEWIEAVGDKLYITESGSRQFNFDRQLALGGKLALHQEKNRTKDNNFQDPFGRILVLDLKTNEMRVLLNGGVDPTDSLFCFASPDAMTAAKINGKDYLIISEDSQPYLNGKASDSLVVKGHTYNEIFFLDLSIARPTLKDLKRFIMAPEGCETTGNYFTPDGKTYFVSIQHPSETNPAPFNKSCVIAISGF